MSGGDWKRMLSAIHENDLEQVKYYIHEGIDPNYQHPEVMVTPLIESIAYERYEIAQFLLENGASPTLRAGFGSENPLNTARKVKNKDLINLIKSYLPKSSSSWLGRIFS